MLQAVLQVEIAASSTASTVREVPERPAEGLLTSGASIAFQAQGCRRPSDAELEELMTAAKWAAANCFMEPQYMGEAFSLSIGSTSVAAAHWRTKDQYAAQPREKNTVNRKEPMRARHHLQRATLPCCSYTTSR